MASREREDESAREAESAAWWRRKGRWLNQQRVASAGEAGEREGDVEARHRSGYLHLDPTVAVRAD